MKKALLNFVLKMLLPQRGKAKLVDSIVDFDFTYKSLQAITHINRDNRYFIDSLNPEILIEVAAQVSILELYLNAFSNHTKLTIPKKHLLAKARIDSCKVKTLDTNPIVVKACLSSGRDSIFVFKFTCSSDTLLKDEPFLEGSLFLKAIF